MADDSDQEKTHDPTDAKKRQFREEGKVAKSQEITGAAGLLVGFGVLLLYSSKMSMAMTDLAVMCWSVTTEPNIRQLFARVGVALVAALAVPLGVMWLGSGVVGLIQSRMIIPKEPLKLEWGRINPISQFKEKFLTPAPLVELVKGLLKIGLVGASVWMGISPQLPLLVSLSHQDPIVLLTTLHDLTWLVLLRAMPVAAAIAALDYSYQVWRMNEKMMMSLEEVKQDQKNAEGDPQFKAARRRRQMEIAQSVASISSVQEADVLLVNPTHYAIALRYRKEEAPAPVVLAKGLDLLALKMQAEARRHDVPRVENKLLARALYAQAETGQVIPEDLYAAVAEILAIIYQKRAARRQQ